MQGKRVRVVRPPGYGDQDQEEDESTGGDLGGQGSGGKP